MLRKTAALAAAAFAIGLAVPASAIGATAAHAGTRAITGTAAGVSPLTGQTCVSHWKWKVFYGLSRGTDYSEVEWTSNPCGYIIEDRSTCQDIWNHSYYTYSGRVRGTYIWDAAHCKAWTDAIHHGAKEYLTNDGWVPFKTYWSG